jgi:hypothetical protein
MARAAGVPLNCKDWKYKVPETPFRPEIWHRQGKQESRTLVDMSSAKFPGSAPVCITDNHICTPCKLNTEGFE